MKKLREQETWKAKQTCHGAILEAVCDRHQQEIEPATKGYAYNKQSKALSSQKFILKEKKVSKAKKKTTQWK